MGIIWSKGMNILLALDVDEVVLPSKKVEPVYDAIATRERPRLHSPVSFGCLVHSGHCFSSSVFFFFLN